MATLREDLCTRQRLYIETAYGEPVVARLKSLGAHWDSERRMWWIGSAKRAAVLALLGESVSPAAGQEPAREDPATIRLAGKCRYKGRTYYARYIGETKKGYSCRLVSLDQSVDFWAGCARPGEPGDGSGDVACVLKTYPPREYRGRTEYTTLASIQRFVAQQKDPATRRGECTECGAWGPVGESCSECGGEGSYA